MIERHCSNQLISKDTQTEIYNGALVVVFGINCHSFTSVLDESRFLSSRQVLCMVYCASSSLFRRAPDLASS